MNDSVTKKDLVEILKSFGQSFKVELKTELKTELKAELMVDINKSLDKRFSDERTITNQKFDEMGKEIGRKFTSVLEIMDDGFKGVHDRLDRLEGNHDRRITIVEDRVRVIKNVIEKGLNKKVAW